MPEETATAPPQTTETPPAESADGGEPQSPNDWFRETATGLTSTRPLDTGDREKEWADANAELRRGRKNGAAKPVEEDSGGTAKTADAEEPPPSRPERDEEEFLKRVQAEVDRREAVRKERADAQLERELRQTNPVEYAKYKAAQEERNLAARNIGETLRTLSQQFDDAAVKPIMDALATDEARNDILSKAVGHGIPQRKDIVEKALAALKKQWHDEGFNKGKESAQKSLRKSSAFRKELLSEIRQGEEEPELASGNGHVGDDGFSMNDFMRSALGRRTR